MMMVFPSVGPNWPLTAVRLYISWYQIKFGKHIKEAVDTGIRQTGKKT